MLLPKVAKKLGTIVGKYVSLSHCPIMNVYGKILVPHHLVEKNQKQR